MIHFAHLHLGVYLKVNGIHLIIYFWIHNMYLKLPENIRNAVIRKFVCTVFSCSYKTQHYQIATNRFTPCTNFCWKSFGRKIVSSPSGSFCLVNAIVIKRISNTFFVFHKRGNVYFFSSQTNLIYILWRPNLDLPYYVEYWDKDCLARIDT